MSKNIIDSHNGVELKRQQPLSEPARLFASTLHSENNVGQQRHNPWKIRKNKIREMGIIKPGLMASEICPT